MNLRRGQPWCRMPGCYAADDLAVPVLAAGPLTFMLPRWACPRCRAGLTVDDLVSAAVWRTVSETTAALGMDPPEMHELALRWGRGPKARQFMADHIKQLATAA